MSGEQEASARQKNPRSVRGSLLLVALLICFYIIATYQPRGAAPVFCERDLVPDADTVVMLSASWCGYCRRARNWFTEENVKYCEYDVERSAEGARRYKQARAGVVPIILVGTDKFVGFDRTVLQQALVAHDLMPFAKLETDD